MDTENRELFAKSIGITGTNIQGGFLASDFNDKFNQQDRHKIYNEMYRSDGIVQMVVNALTTPILALDWTIESENEQLKEEIENILGIKKTRLFPDIKFDNWNFILRNCLISLRHGFVLFEKIWTLSNSKYIIKKLALRHPKTIYRWITDKNEYISHFQIEPTDNNSFLAVEQMDYDDNNYKSGIFLPREKLLYIAFNQEGTDYAGFSILRGAYKHWMYRDTFYRFDGFKQERHSSPTPYIKHSGNISQERQTDYENLLKQMKVDANAFAMFSDDVLELGFLKSEIADTKLLESVNHHKELMVQSILANALLLGSSTASGSRATAGEQLDFFNFFLISIAEQIKEAIENDVIEDYKLKNNYTDEVKLTYSGIQKRDYSGLIQQINDSLSSGGITKDIYVEEKLRQVIGLEMMEDYEKVQKEKQDQEVANQKIAQKKVVEKKMNEVEFVRQLAEFTPEELAMREKIRQSVLAKVDFEKIAEKGSKNDIRLEKIYLDFLSAINNTILEKTKQIADSRDFAKLNDISVPNTQKVAMQKDLEALMNENVEFGKKMMAEWLNVPVESSNKEIKQMIKMKSDLITQKIVSDLIYQAQSVASEFILRDVSKNTIVDAVNQSLISKSETIVNQGKGRLSQEMQTRGQNYQANLNDDQVKGWVWAINQKRIPKDNCAFCRGMRGTITSKYDRVVHQFSPPVHNGCACAWIPIIQADLESDKPIYSDPIDPKIDMKSINNFES